MNRAIPVNEAQARFKQLIAALELGEEVLITENEQPVARLVGQRPPAVRPVPGLGKGSVIYMAPDFDEPTEEFRESTE